MWQPNMRTNLSSLQEICPYKESEGVVGRKRNRKGGRQGQWEGEEEGGGDIRVLKPKWRATVTKHSFLTTTSTRLCSEAHVQQHKQRFLFLECVSGEHKEKPTPRFLTPLLPPEALLQSLCEGDSFSFILLTACFFQEPAFADLFFSNKKWTEIGSTFWHNPNRTLKPHETWL